MSLEENRFQDEKHKRKAKRLIKEVWREPDLAEDEKFVGIESGVHSRRCSCPMCRMNRRNPLLKGKSRLTMQERRMDEAEAEQLDEAGFVGARSAS